MTPPSRAPRSTPAAALLLLALALGGCGGTSGTDSSKAAPTSASASASAPTPTEDTSAATSDSSTTSPTASPTPSNPRAQVIAVQKYGISFELPRSWITLDAGNALKNGAGSPLIKELADRLGTSPDRLVSTFANAVQTLSVSDAGAVHGFVDNVNSLGQEGDVNDDQIKLQLATVGARPGTLSHASTPAGDVIRAPYTLPTKTGPTIHAVVLAVRTGTATVAITVSSSTASRAAAIADQVQGSLARLPGGGSGL